MVRRNITFKPDQIKWLDEKIASGAYASVEEAVRAAIAEMMSIDEDALDWAKPLVDEARAALARGEGLKAVDVKAETEAYLRSLGG